MQPKAQIPSLEGITPDTLPPELEEQAMPVVLRGFVADWPIVTAAKNGAKEVAEYLSGFYNGVPIVATSGDASYGGYVAYGEDMRRPNITRDRKPLTDVLAACLACEGDENPPLHYVASTTMDDILPGLTSANPLPLGARRVLASIWLGNRSLIPAHQDLPDNIACVAAGRRRFTLFPPDQLENLYVGPLDFTPGGQPISIVDPRNPDFDRFPKYRSALEAALVAELEPGDAIYIPSMWWHQVEGLDSLNVLMNYWWRQSPAYMGPPIDTLYHALLTMRDLPAQQRAAWKQVFDHYIFEHDAETLDHIPEEARGALGELDEMNARRILQHVLNRINR